MCRPIGAAKSKQSDTEALCQPGPTAQSHQNPLCVGPIGLAGPSPQLHATRRVRLVPPHVHRHRGRRRGRRGPRPRAVPRHGRCGGRDVHQRAPHRGHGQHGARRARAVRGLLDVATLPGAAGDPPGGARERRCGARVLPRGAGPRREAGGSLRFRWRGLPRGLHGPWRQRGAGVWNPPCWAVGRASNGLSECGLV